MSVVLLGSLLLAVSLISVVIYMAALGQLLIGDRQPGMVRVGLCRLVAALLYVGVALITLHTNETGPLVGLGVFTVVQLMWQLNSVADVLLTRRQRRTPVPRHESGSPPTPPPLSGSVTDSVVSAEIDRLSGRATETSQETALLRDDVDAMISARRFGWAGLVFTFVVAVIACLLGVLGTESVSDLARRNAGLIDELRVATCAEHALTLGSYSTRAGDAYPRGRQVYDTYMRDIIASSQTLGCGISPLPDLPARVTTP